MSRREKIVGLIVGLAALLGALAVVLGNLAIGLLGALALGVFGMYVAVQTLRDVRRQKRTSELLREYLQNFREDMRTRFQMNERTLNAYVDERIEQLSGHVEAVGGSVESKIAKSESRVTASVLSSGAEGRRTQQVISQKILAHQDGMRHVLDALGATSLEAHEHFEKVCNQARLDLDERAAQARDELESERIAMLVQLEERSKQISEQLGAGRAAVIAEMADSESRLAASVVSGGAEIRRAQQVISQKTLAQLDGLRLVLETIAAAQKDQLSGLDSLQMGVDEARQSLTDVVASPADVASLMAEQGSAISALRSELTLIGDQFGEGVERILAEGARSMEDTERFLSNAIEGPQALLQMLHRTVEKVESATGELAQQEALDSMTLSLASHKGLLAQIDSQLEALNDQLRQGVKRLVSHEDQSRKVQERQMADALVSALAGPHERLRTLLSDVSEIRMSLDDLAAGTEVKNIAEKLVAQDSAVAGLYAHMRAIDDRLANTAREESVGAIESTLAEVLERSSGAEARSETLQSAVASVDEHLEALLREHRPRASLSMGDISDRLEELRGSADSDRPTDGLDIEVAVESHRESLDRTWRILRLVKDSSALTDEQREKTLDALYSLLGMQDVRQEFVLDIEKFDIGVSFRSQMVRLLLLKQRLLDHGYDLSPRVNDKLADREFAHRLGVPTPSTLAQGVLTEDLDIIPGSFIKPSVGESANGVFYIRPDGKLLSMRSRKTYGSIEEAAPEYEHLFESDSSLRWIVEEAVLGDDSMPARDFKVFMFYGQVGLSREILRGQGDAGGHLIATYNSNGTPIAYRARDDTFDGGGVPESVVNFASKISLESPMPFLRVDFLIGVDGPVLGEITPHPGGIYAGDADDEVDRELGEMYLDADARLVIDLLNGKSFSEYFASYRARKDGS